MTDNKKRQQPAIVEVKKMPRPIAPYGTSGDQGIWWPFRIPRRIWFTLGVISSPVRAVALVLEMTLTSCVLAVVATGWAWWTHRITDDQVAAVLSTTGERLLSILSKSGVLQ